MFFICILSTSRDPVGKELHSLIGVCPQQNVAVSSLTIREQVSSSP
jgi:hypothetical protein